MDTEREAGRPGIPDEPRRISDGGPAFPVTHREHSIAPGMTLRDWFAGQALAGMATGRDWSTNRGDDMQMLAQQAYVIADAMLAERGA